MCVCVYAHARVHVEAGDVESSRARVTGSCEPPEMCAREWNSGSLREQGALVTTEPSLHPNLHNFKLKEVFFPFPGKNLKLAFSEGVNLTDAFND